MWDVGAAAPRASVVSDPHLPAEAAMFDLALRPDGECVVGIAQDRTITMIESIGREPRAVAVAISEAVGVGFSEGGRALALLAGDGPAGERLRWLPSGEPVDAPLPRMVSPSIASSRDGTLVRLRDAPAVNRTGGGSSQAHAIRILDASTGDELHHVSCDVGDAGAFGALPNGRTVLATADGTDDPEESGRTIVIRDARSGEALQRVRGHAGKVFAIAFTPDGRRMLSAGRDRLIRVWDTGAWDEVVSLVGPNAYVWALRFSPDGLRLAISSGDRTYRVWTTRSALP